MGHVEKAAPELSELARAVMRQRLERIAVAAADASGAADQFVHRPGDGSVEDEANDHGRGDDGEPRQQEFSTLLVKMVKNVARGPRSVDHAGNVIVDNDRHGGKDVYADAAADGIDRRRYLVELADPQRRAILSFERSCHFLDMGERLADLLASGDHDAVLVKNPESCQRDLLRLQHDRGQPGADLDIGRIGRDTCRTCVGPTHQEVVAGEIEGRPDWRDRVLGIRACFRRQLSAECDAAIAPAVDLAGIDGGQHLALGDQLGLGLVDELVVIEPEEEQSDERQGGDRGQHGKDNQPDRRPPFFALRRFRHVCGSQRPSLNPTP